MIKEKVKIVVPNSLAEITLGQYQEYLNSLAESMGYGKPKPVTMEEVQAQHDAWWDSLTDEEKQKLYEEAEAAEQDRIDNDMNGPNSQYGV